MSLVLWLPLDGNIINRGVRTYTTSTLGTLSWVEGKTGAMAMRAGDGTQIVNGIQINNTFTDILNKEYTVCVWVKPYGSHIHYNGSIFSCVELNDGIIASGGSDNLIKLWDD